MLIDSDGVPPGALDANGSSPCSEPAERRYIRDARRVTANDIAQLVAAGERVPAATSEVAGSQMVGDVALDNLSRAPAFLSPSADGIVRTA